MKQRITLSIEPDVSRRAKKLARARNTSVSGLVEQFLLRAPLHDRENRPSFVARWLGRFTVAPSQPGDTRMRKLKARFGLTRS